MYKIKFPMWVKNIFCNKKTNKTIYQCFKPILQISSIGGICTLVERKNKYVVSKVLVVFQGVMIFLNLAHLVLVPNAMGNSWFMQQLDSWTNPNQTYIKHSNEEADFFVTMANPLVISSSTLALRVLNLCLLHTNLPNIFKIIEHAKKSVDFGNINCKDYAYAKFLIILILMLSFPYQMYTAYSEYNFQEAHNVLKYLILTFNHYNNFAAVCLETQFSYMCYILKNRFEIVNKHLRRSYEIDIVKLNIKKSITLWNNQQPAQLKSIIDLRDCHHKLSESCIYLNKLYSIQLLISLTACLINILLNFYFAIYGGFIRGSDPTSVKNIMMQTLWGLYYAVRFVDICAVAESLSKEASLTKILICDQLAQCNDRNLKDMLWTFHAYTISSEVTFTAMGFFKIDLSLISSLWTFHAYTISSEVTFTAMGFFKIDLSLISSAVSAGTTYLVILAQFHGQKQQTKNH